ncbi:MAG: cyclic nucleotide-binding domain-containing protein [Lachnospiraceae bacterium]|nr:cyclic nucleotide-binding domain-containing protein [Lachnospiraceae bacterium]
MAITIKMNAMNQVPKGETLFENGATFEGVFVVLKGKGVLKNANLCIPVVSGDFLGIWDLHAGVYGESCVATEEMTVYALPAKTTDDLQTMLEGNKEYGGRMTACFGRYISEMWARRSVYMLEAKKLPEVISELYRQYGARCKEEEIRAAELPAAAGATVTEAELPAWMEYYLEAAKVPGEVQKNYFSHGTKVVLRHVEEQMQIIRWLFAECEKLGEFLRRQGAALINGGADNLFFYFCALEEKTAIAETKKVAGVLQEITEKKLTELKDLFDKCAGEPFEGYEKRRTARKTGTGPNVAGEEPCEHTLEQIFSFAGVSEEFTKEYSELLGRFDAMEDKTSTEDTARRLRRQLADGFYQLYEIIFKKTYGMADTDIPLPIRMFLDFGFIDETLVSRSQMLELEKLELTPVTGEKNGCHIFSIREWLSWVYEGKREPSKNEFDQEYTEMLRDLRKSGQITEEEERAKLKDYDERLHYEIQNLFRYNHRLVNGQLSIFVPFLYEELLAGDPARSFLSKSTVQASVDKLRRVDYSLFYREFLYMNKELGIEKEYRMAEVLPDIILFPTMGSKSVLWQDISCRRRDTPGRFLLPMFAEVSIDDLLIRVCGRYRWELCRTIQGAAWNNIQIKSLTSEYTDYLMYYKKNRDISEERKERVKAQLQKGKNNYREVFAMDYEVWMKNESSGAMKLNKVAREILATYCPFEGKIRAQLAQQPAFEEAMARHRRETARKLRETELRNHALTKNGIELPQELLDTLAYYHDN